MTRAFDSHDHTHCEKTGLAELERHCADNKLRLTPVRRRVFEILQSQHKAMGAYDILEILQKEGLGSQPPVAYRALDFLVGNGFAHKIEGLNAFIACSHPGDNHIPAFLICRKCARVAETDPQTNALRRQASDAGFSIEHTVVEAMGVCPDCSETAA